MRAWAFLIFLIPLIFPKTVFAAFSFSITSTDTQNVISPYQEVKVVLNLNNLPSGDSYFRIGWESGNSYVGYLKNNSGDWIKLTSLTSDKTNQNCLNYFKINGATSSATLSIKVGNDNAVSNGSVKIRAERFTSTCASYTSTEPFEINVNIPNSPKTPSPTQKPTITNSPIPSILETKILNKPDTFVEKEASNSVELSTFDSPNPQLAVLGENVVNEVPTKTPNKITPSKKPVIGIILIFSGISLVLISISLFFVQFRRRIIKNT